MNIAIITGATSGIGNATLNLLLEKGFKVYAGYRDIRQKKKLAALSKNVVPFRIDLTKKWTIEEAIKFLNEAEEYYDVLINAAGKVVAGPLETLPMAKLREQFEVNAFAHLEFSQGLLAKLKGGKIINVSSMASYGLFPFIGPYCASKSTLDMLFELLRIETRSMVKIISVKPGVIATPLWEKAIEDNLDNLQDEKYRAIANYLIDNAKHNAKYGLRPQIVARKIYSIIKMHNPKTSYTVGNDAKVAKLTSKLPRKVINALIEGALDSKLKKYMTKEERKQERLRLKEEKRLQKEYKNNEKAQERAMKKAFREGKLPQDYIESLKSETSSEQHYSNMYVNLPLDESKVTKIETDSQKNLINDVSNIEENTNIQMNENTSIDNQYNYTDEQVVEYPQENYEDDIQQQYTDETQQDEENYQPQYVYEYDETSQPYPQEYVEEEPQQYPQQYEQQYEQISNQSLIHDENEINSVQNGMYNYDSQNSLNQLSPKELKAKERAERKALKEQEKQRKRDEKLKAKEEKLAQREAKRAEKEKIKLMSKDEKRAYKLQLKEQKIQERLLKKQEKLREKEEKQAQKEAKRAEKEKIKLMSRDEKRAYKAQLKEQKAQERLLRKQEKLREKEEKRKAKEEKRASKIIGLSGFNNLSPVHPQYQEDFENEVLEPLQDMYIIPEEQYEQYEQVEQYQEINPMEVQYDNEYNQNVYQNENIEDKSFDSFMTAEMNASSDIQTDDSEELSDALEQAIQDNKPKKKIRKKK